MIEAMASAEPQTDPERDRLPSEPEIELRMLELRHRIKNILAIV